MNTEEDIRRFEWDNRIGAKRYSDERDRLMKELDELNKTIKQKEAEGRPVYAEKMQRDLIERELRKPYAPEEQINRNIRILGASVISDDEEAMDEIRHHLRWIYRLLDEKNKTFSRAVFQAVEAKRMNGGTDSVLSSFTNEAIISRIYVLINVRSELEKYFPEVFEEDADDGNKKNN